MIISNKLRLFFGVSMLLFLVNLLVMNDVSTIWPGAEATFVTQALDETPTAYLPLAAARLFSGGELSEFLLRLPGILVLLIGLGLGVWLALPILGEASVWGMLLVLSASWLSPNLAKLASGDVWVLAVHSSGLLALLRFLKQPQARWRWLFYGLLALACWIAPLKSFLLFTAVSLFIYWAHPQGKRLAGLYAWFIAPVLAALVYGLQLAPLDGEFLYFPYQFGTFFLFNILGVLPFLGFLAAGLRDLSAKLRKGEERSIILLAWIGAALLAQSVALQLALALIIARQMQLVFEERYPYQGWVRGGSILYLLMVFLFSTLLMMGGYSLFQGTGFRAALTFSAVCWIPGLMAIFGLFIRSRRLVWGGSMASGLLATTFFWLQLGPLLQTRRDLPQQISKVMDQRLQQQDLPLALPGGAAAYPLPALYLRERLGKEVQDLNRLKAGREEAVWVISPRTPALPELSDTISLKAWDQNLGEQAWIIGKLDAGPKSE